MCLRDNNDNLRAVLGSVVRDKDETNFPASTLTLLDEKGNVVHQVPK